MTNKKIKIKIVPFKITDFKADEEAGTIEAYVSIFGNVDFMGEVIDKGAFSESIAKKLPKGVWSHNWDEPIAVTVEAREDDKGLYIKGKFIKGIQRADEAFLALKAGAIDEFSIGFSVQEDYIGDDSFRHLKKIRLYEWSPVLVGANPATELISAKGIEKEIEVTPDLKEAEVGDACTMADGAEGMYQEDGDGVLICIMPKAGDKCFVDGQDGTFEDVDGAMVCVVPKAEDDEKSGKVLSAKNRAIIENALVNMDELTNTINGLKTPLKDLLEATSEPDKGIDEVEPIAEGVSAKKVLRIRHAVKVAIQANRAVIRLTR